MIARRVAGAALAIAALATSLYAQDIKDFEKRLTEHTLDNGLTFLILERPGAPVISFYNHVDVGADREHYGITGLAHMFEHMAFKGTSRIGTENAEAEAAAIEAEDRAYSRLAAARRGPNADPERIEELTRAFKEAQEKATQYIVKEEFSNALNAAGGTGLNAFTNADTTGYIVSLPANRVELWAYLESERFLDPVFREFYQERDVVQEERRMRTESQPVGRMIEEMITTAFKAHPYGHPIVGHMSDLQAFTRQDAQAFYSRYYIPSNMVISIVGDVKAKEILPMLETYFGRLPARPEPEPVRTVEPEQIGEKTIRIEDPSQPIWAAAYHRPALVDEDSPALDALTDLLGSGRTSRLYERLVKEEKAASFVGVFNGFPGDKYSNLMVIYAVPSKDYSAEQVGEIIDEEIAKIKKNPPTAEELEGVKARARANFIRGLDSNMGMAMGLAKWETRTGDWRDLFHRLDRINAVTPEDVKEVADNYLQKKNRTVGIIVTSTQVASK